MTEIEIKIKIDIEYGGIEKIMTGGMREVAK